MSSKLPEALAMESLIDQLYGLRQSNILENQKSRKAALGLARRIVSALDDPLNVATDMMFFPNISAAVEVAVDLNLYELIKECNEGSITTAELSRQSGGQELLIGRVLRLLDSIGFVEQVDRDKWTATSLTRAMAQPPIMAGFRFLWDIVVPPLIKAPQYLRENNFTCPTQPTDGILQYAHQTQYNAFEYMAKVQPNRLVDFNNFMGNVMGSRKYWVDWYPAQGRIIDGWTPDTTLLVDVGGGRGHDIKAFGSKYPDVRDSLILQDLPNVLDGSDQGQNDGIKRQPQDFFTPNQTKGARAYFLHHILHDWSDEYALKILSHLRDAMTPGYSKIVIHDAILPDIHASTFQTVLDITMLAFASGMERDRSQWSELLDKAGFEVVGFWINEEQADADGIVEAVIKGSGTA